MQSKYNDQSLRDAKRTKKKMVGKKFKYYLLLFSCLRDDD